MHAAERGPNDLSSGAGNRSLVHDDGAKLLEFFFIESLSEKVSEVIMRVHIRHFEFEFLDHISDEEMPPLDMLGFCPSRVEPAS